MLGGKGVGVDRSGRECENIEIVGCLYQTVFSILERL
jgi:hypothetical protein